MSFYSSLCIEILPWHSCSGIFRQSFPTLYSNDSRLTERHVSLQVEFQIPKEVSAGLINNQKEHYDFKFNGIISSEAKQDEARRRELLSLKS